MRSKDDRVTKDSAFRMSLLKKLLAVEPRSGSRSFPTSALDRPASLFRASSLLRSEVGRLKKKALQEQNFFACAECPRLCGEVSEMNDSKCAVSADADVSDKEESTLFFAGLGTLSKHLPTYNLSSQEVKRAAADDTLELKSVFHTGKDMLDLFFYPNERKGLSEMSARYYWQTLSSAWIGKLDELTMSFELGATLPLRLMTLQRIISHVRIEKLHVWGCIQAVTATTTVRATSFPALVPREANHQDHLYSTLNSILEYFFLSPWLSAKCSSITFTHCQVSPRLFQASSGVDKSAPCVVPSITAHGEANEHRSMLQAPPSLITRPTMFLRELFFLSCSLDGILLASLIRYQVGLRRVVLEYPTDPETIQWNELGDAVGRNSSIKTLQFQGCNITAEKLSSFVHGYQEGFASSTTPLSLSQPEIVTHIQQRRLHPLRVHIYSDTIDKNTSRTILQSSTPPILT